MSHLRALDQFCGIKGSVSSMSARDPSSSRSEVGATVGSGIKSVGVFPLLDTIVASFIILPLKIEKEIENEMKRNERKEISSCNAPVVPVIPGSHCCRQY